MLSLWLFLQLLCGAVYPQEFIDKAYNYMLQNHGHDSIGACGRDVVYNDVDYRFRQSQEIATCVLERALWIYPVTLTLRDGIRMIWHL